MTRQNRAFTLIELILIVLFVGVFAAIAVPRFSLSVVTKQKADSLARKIVIDLRRTRRLTISDAANNKKGFELVMLGSNPYTGYQIENMDTDEIVDSHTLDADVVVTGNKNFEKFHLLGGLRMGSGRDLTVSASGKTFTISVSSATGMVKCTEN